MDNQPGPSKSNTNDQIPITNTPKRPAPGPVGFLPHRPEKLIFNTNTSSLLQPVPRVVNVDENDEVEMGRRQLIEGKILSSIPPSNQEGMGITWTELTRFLKDRPESSNIMKVVKDISWVQNYTPKLITCDVIPFLIVMIRANPRYHPSRFSVCVLAVKVFDPSGTIDIVIPKSVFEKYQSLLLPGTVLVVKNAGLHNEKRPDVFLSVGENSLIYIGTNAEIPENTNTNAPQYDIVYEAGDEFKIIKVSQESFSYKTLVQDYNKLTDPTLKNDKVVEYKREVFGENKKHNSSSSSKSGGAIYNKNYSNFNNKNNTNTIDNPASEENTETTEDAKMEPSDIMNDDEDINSHSNTNPQIESDYVIEYREQIHRSPLKNVVEYINNKNNNKNSNNKSSSSASSASVGAKPSTSYNNMNNNTNNNPASEANTERVEDVDTGRDDFMDDAYDADLVQFLDDYESPDNPEPNNPNLENQNQNPIQENLGNADIIGEFPDEGDDADLALLMDQIDPPGNPEPNNPNLEPPNQNPVQENLENDNIIGEFPDEGDDAFLGNLEY